MSTSALWGRPLLEECGLPGSISWVAWFAQDVSLDFIASDDGFPTAQPDTSGFVITKIPAPALREVEAVYNFFVQFNPALQPKLLPGCKVGVAVEALFADPADLSYLQTNLAICRGLARLGAVALFDTKAWRFWDGDEMFNFASERNFAIAEHISVFNMNHPKIGPYCHTRGLCKFARPEVFVTGLTEADQHIPEFLNELALRLALGKNYENQVVVQLEHPTGVLPPVTFEAFLDDTQDPEPKHGMGTNRFGNASIRVVDFDEEVPEARPDCKFLLAALRDQGASGYDRESSGLGINFQAWE